MSRLADELEAAYPDGQAIGVRLDPETFTRVMTALRTADAEPGDRYLITKNGAYYRPNAQGYTTSKQEAGRFTLEEAIAHSHPNGPDGPRDGIRYELDDAEQGGDVTGLDAEELSYLSQKVSADFLVYVGHAATGCLKPDEIARMGWLDALHSKLAALNATLLERLAPAAVRREALEKHRFGSPPEPVVNPSSEWLEDYADWYYQGKV